MTHGSHGIDYEKDMNRFLSEARVLARFCNEPDVVGVRDFFRENGTAYIVMEYLDGITLKDYIIVGAAFATIAGVSAYTLRKHLNSFFGRSCK